MRGHVPVAVLLAGRRFSSVRPGAARDYAVQLGIVGTSYGSGPRIGSGRSSPRRFHPLPGCAWRGSLEKRRQRQDLDSPNGSLLLPPGLFRRNRPQRARLGVCGDRGRSKSASVAGGGALRRRRPNLELWGALYQPAGLHPGGGPGQPARLCRLCGGTLSFFRLRLQLAQGPAQPRHIVGPRWPGQRLRRDAGGHQHLLARSPSGPLD